MSLTPPPPLPRLLFLPSPPHRALLFRAKSRIVAEEVRHAARAALRSAAALCADGAILTPPLVDFAIGQRLVCLFNRIYLFEIFYSHAEATIFRIAVFFFDITAFYVRVCIYMHIFTYLHMKYMC
jgi:hypothetical protein